jgi:hypothetical protein
MITQTHPRGDRRVLESGILKKISGATKQPMQRENMHIKTGR